jgi:hypothetical protein
MDILERYPGRYDVLDFYGRLIVSFKSRKVAEKFAAWNPEPDSCEEELHCKYQAWRPERVRS